MKDEQEASFLAAFIVHRSSLIVHTSLNCGVAFASKNARISLAGLREISSRGDSSYQSLGKKRVYVSCVKRRQRSAITPMSLSLRMTRPADCTTRVIPGIK